MTYLFTLPFADVGQGIIPSDGALLYFYSIDGITPKTTWNDSQKNTANANPVEADADGIFPAIWLDGIYSVALFNKNGVQQWFAPLVSSGGASGMVSVNDFGVVGDGVTDDTAAFLALPSGLSYYMPEGTYLVTQDIWMLGSQMYAMGYAQLSPPFMLHTGTSYGVGALVNDDGDNSAAPNTSGRNTAIGAYALNANTSGYHGTAIGNGALRENTTGTQNTAIGMNALCLNVAGVDNTAIGVSALLNIEGSKNTAVGRAAGIQRLTGDYNVLIGRDVQYACTDGSYDTAIGAEACWDLTSSGGYNAIVGYRSCYGMTTTGTKNVALGAESSYGIDTASRTTALGYRSLFANTANDTTACGYETLYSNTSGLRNTAIGAYAGYTNITGLDNTFIGWQAGYYSTGNSNIAIGTSASASASGSYNTSIGSNSGQALTSGASNVCIGYEAGKTITTGTGNTLIGRGAAPAAVGATGDIAIYSNNAVRLRYTASSTTWDIVGTVVQNTVDNTCTLGSASYRWSVVYAGTGAINTSDGRLKQDVRCLDDAERAVAVKCKSLIRAFRFIDAVTEKGDGARVHFGVIAQDVRDAFESEGLDANKYALFCYDEWEGGDRYGIRYDELLAFIISAM